MASAYPEKDKSKTDETSKRSFKIPAFDRILLYLGQRDHSESELRQKMRLKYEREEITAAIEKAKSAGYLPETAEQLQKFSQKVAMALHRKKKGIHYINGYLRKKGLPPVSLDSETELENALAVVRAMGRKSTTSKDPKKRQQQIRSRLSSRGFHPTIISQILKTRGEL